MSTPATPGSQRPAAPPPNIFGRGPEGSGATTIVTGFTQAEYDQIVSIANNVYGISDLGGTPITQELLERAARAEYRSMGRVLGSRATVLQTPLPMAEARLQGAGVRVLR